MVFAIAIQTNTVPEQAQEHSLRRNTYMYVRKWMEGADGHWLTSCCPICLPLLPFPPRLALGAHGLVQRWDPETRGSLPTSIVTSEERIEEKLSGMAGLVCFLLM